ncbi:MAG: RNA polymerase factor sigma-32 [Proteobacteria bacterium]|nr:RNA polymerase factor sigma-32 [Pseudomonadota bacterium]
MTKLPAVRSGERALATLSPIQLYLQQIAKYPLLEPEEEYELARQQFDEGDVRSAHRLVTANLRLVVKIANDFRQAQLNLLDLIQEGNYGLMQAVKRFNPYKGVKLSSYAAWWIRAYILKYIMDNRSQVKIGTTADQRKLYYNLERTARKLLQEYDHVDAKMLAEHLNVREKDVEEMQARLAAPDLSLDAPLSNESDSVTRGQLLASSAESTEDALADDEVRRIFADHLADFRETLKGRDLEVFDARMMAEDPLTLQEIGDRYGVTRERARQIESRIIQKLREFVSKKGLLDAEVVRG